MINEFDTKKYIKGLDLIQLKVLIYLCLIESNYIKNNKYLKHLKNIKKINDYLTICYPKKEEWEKHNPIYIIARINYYKEKKEPCYVLIILDDFNIRIVNEYYSETHDKTLQKFLISQYGIEYKNYLYEYYISQLPYKIDSDIFNKKQSKNKILILLKKLI